MDEVLSAYQRIISLNERTASIVAAWTAGKTMAQIGDEFGISKQRVHQIVEPCRPLLAPFRPVKPEPEGRLCSTCGATTLQGQDMAHRKFPSHYFWPYVDKAEDGCWTWVGPTYPSARGYVEYGRTQSAPEKYAHRESYRLHFGPVPAGMVVMHTCDNPPCVRPDHLVAGSYRSNAVDRDEKGRTGMHNGFPVCRVKDIDERTGR